MPSLRETLAKMAAEGRIDRAKEEYINSRLEEWVEDSRYVLLNLGIHISIGLVRFTAIPIPLPIGSILRALWVAANRIYYTIRRDAHRSRVHSTVVFLFAAVPFLGYFAYTIPLKERSEYLTYLYAEHVSYSLYNKTLEEKLENAPGFIKRIGYALLVP